ncbi:MAG: M20/M25/M40 family metallo-hydrolase [Flavobacteriales bacterium]|nr:M20/M25/M40 family metallo-hydrolase [Flavobacteriales bacterium]
MKYKIFTLLMVLMASSSYSKYIQNVDSVQIRKIFDMALEKGEAYENLRTLCKGIGHRLSGTAAADSAVNWGYKLLSSMNLDTVYKIPVMVPHWNRGDVEEASVQSTGKRLKITALGGSVGTKGALISEIVFSNGLDELKSLGVEKIKGKIVVFNDAFDPKKINTFEAYSACVGQRYSGASEAAKYGAVAVLVRSMTNKIDSHPHTGSMGYSDPNLKIPAAAISTEDTEYLFRKYGENPGLKVSLKLTCETLKDKPSFNVVAEIKGSKSPQTIITVGGHLDSWDIGEGAHDDGAGIVHSIELLRLIKAGGYKPAHTIRVVLFMNEENGNKGGETYASWVKERGEHHLMALESDAGGHTPRGFSISSSDDQLASISAFRSLLEPYGCHVFRKSNWGGGVDINPLKLNEKISINKDMILMGFIPDSQRYFDYHHAATDVFENVHQRELELGAASIAAMIYLMDKYF